MDRPVRGTQTLVDQMGWVLKHPSPVVVEIVWRWLFGIAFLLVCRHQAERILALAPPSTAGFDTLDRQNPWVAAVQLQNIGAHYVPHLYPAIIAVLPIAMLAWVVASGIGRALVLRCLEPGVRFRPFAMMALQVAWLALFTALIGLYGLAMGHSVATHFSAGAEPDLVGLAIWSIFLALGLFTVWAMISWPPIMAAVLMLCEERPPLGALMQSLRLGRMFTGKLIEINFVMGIVMLMLIVLAMVFSAAPLPFSDQLGRDALHAINAGSILFYLVASDYFQVVRLKSFLEFRRTFRDSAQQSERARLRKA